MQDCPQGPSSPRASAPFSQVYCPHLREGVKCGYGLLGRIRIPPSMRLYPVALRHEHDDTGRGFVKQCPQCHGFVELINQRAA